MTVLIKILGITELFSFVAFISLISAFFHFPNYLSGAKYFTNG